MKIKTSKTKNIDVVKKVNKLQKLCNNSIDESYRQLLGGKRMRNIKHITDKRLIKKICKQCVEPAEYMFDNVNQASISSDIRKVLLYARCVNSVIRKDKKNEKI